MFRCFAHRALGMYFSVRDKIQQDATIELVKVFIFTLSVFTCVHRPQRSATCVLRGDGVTGVARLHQPAPSAPTTIVLEVRGARSRAGSVLLCIRVHSFVMFG